MGWTEFASQGEGRFEAEKVCLPSGVSRGLFRCEPW